MASTNVYVTVSSTLSRSALEQCRMSAQKLADTLLEPVVLAIVEQKTQENIQESLATSGGKGYLLRPASSAPMGSAPFVYNEDGSPNWGEMWTTFCELALYGGPPHRGPDAPVTSPESFGDKRSDFDAIREMQRGIAATTGLNAEPAQPGWIAVTCTSKMMAAWLCATIILENVDARCSRETLYLPASSEFELMDQVKSVITVVAKAHHYYQMHIAGVIAGTDSDVAALVA